MNTNEIYSIKLCSGEELVAKVLSTDSNTITISDPLSIAPQPQGMGLMPSMFTADHEQPITLNTSTITMYALTADPIRVKYIEATTGITTASKKILVG